MVVTTRPMSWRTLVSRDSVPSCPRKYLEATTLVASSDHWAGNSTSFCSKTGWPPSPCMTASRRSHSTVENGSMLGRDSRRSKTSPVAAASAANTCIVVASVPPARSSITVPPPPPRLRGPSSSAYRTRCPKVASNKGFLHKGVLYIVPSHHVYHNILWIQGLFQVPAFTRYQDSMLGENKPKVDLGERRW